MTGTPGTTEDPKIPSRRIGADAGRAAGAIVGMAVGDALGAPYEFGPSPGVAFSRTAADMVGGGAFNWAPGEWTDDTSMAIPLLRAFATDPPLDGEPTRLTRIVREWRQWALTAPDVGAQTRALLGQFGPDVTGDEATLAAQLLHQRTGRTAGNGSLMRTAPIGLMAGPATSDPSAPGHTLGTVVGWARAVSDLTHGDPETGDAAVLWSVMIHQAVTHGVVDAGLAVACLPQARRALWAGRLAEAADARPGDFPQNGWVVHALQASWAALHRAGLDLTDDLTATSDGFVAAMEQAVNAGSDTDTVAAITGALAGAFVGVDGIPAGWRGAVHGWGGEGIVMRAAQLEELALAVRANSGGDRR